jgi:hypothetical protein
VPGSSLPNGHLKLRHEHLTTHPLLNLLGRSAFEEQFERFTQIFVFTSELSAPIALTRSNQIIPGSGESYESLSRVR